MRNSLWKVTLNLTSHLMGHLSSLFTRSMGHWGCVCIIEPSIRWQWKINTHYFELITCLTNYWELKCLVRLIYIWDITKIDMWKGMKKISFTAQGMVHMKSWWCLLDSPMHSPHFAHSWTTFSGMASWFCGWIHRWHFGP